MYRISRDHAETGNEPSRQVVFYDAGLGTYIGATALTAPVRFVQKLLGPSPGPASAQYRRLLRIHRQPLRTRRQDPAVRLQAHFKQLLRMEPDDGTNNRNMKSKHWTRWLGPEHRCVVPFNSFSEFNNAEGGDIWFALDETRPLACFAGIWTNWTSVRKVKEGETTNDLYAFLTTEPNTEVRAIHPKAMPVILTTAEEVEAWMTAPPEEALKLQRPRPDGALRIVARGVKEDPAPTT
jgi:putative SOS response-associated peptidase YedK